MLSSIAENAEEQLQKSVLEEDGGVERLMVALRLPCFFFFVLFLFPFCGF